MLANKSLFYSFFYLPAAKTALSDSNASVERLFSRSKLAISDKRFSMADKTVEGLGLGHYNSNKIVEKD